MAGTVMIYTLLALLVLSIFLSIVYEKVIDLMRSSRDWIWREKALVAAESGTAAAEARLSENPFWAAGDGLNPELVFTLDESEIVVRTERFRPPDIIWVFSTAFYKRAKKETVRPILIEDPTLFALLAHRSVSLGFGTIVTGAVAGSTVRIAEGGEVYGSVISSGSLDIAKEQKEAAVFDSAASPPIVPSLDLNPFAQSWTKMISGPRLPPEPLKAGYYMAPGDLTIKDARETDVLIRVAGNLNLEGAVDLRYTSVTDTPILIVGKDLTGTLSGARLRGMIYVAGKVKLKGEGLITGTIIADEIELGQGVVVQSFDAVTNLPRPTPQFWKRRVKRIRN